MNSDMHSEGLAQKLQTFMDWVDTELKEKGLEEHIGLVKQVALDYMEKRINTGADVDMKDLADTVVKTLNGESEDIKNDIN